MNRMKWFLMSAMLMAAAAMNAQTLKGDINGDSQVDVSDVTALVSMILGNTTSTTAADVNADGKVDVSDVTHLVSIILGTAPDPYVMAVYTPLKGTSGDDPDEGYEKLFDGHDYTKWCSLYTPGWGNPVAIFKSNTPLVPSSYTLVTAYDSHYYPARNWQSWKIYAANFASDSDANYLNPDWVLVDEKTNIHLPTNPGTPVEFTCSNTVTEAYTYFLIEVTDVVYDGAELQQLGEFAWGTADQFALRSDVTYNVIDAISLEGWKESVYRIFDSDVTTKWYYGNMGDDDAYVIFSTNRPIAPTYYLITTANDNLTHPGRIWTDWKLYGMNTDDTSDLIRNSTKWVLLDERANCYDIPDENYTEVLFLTNQGVTQQYRYFKIEIAEAATTEFQLSEFSLGDAYTLSKIKDTYYNAVCHFDLSRPMQKSLVTAYTEALEQILAASNIQQVAAAYANVLALQTTLNDCATAYASYIKAVSVLRNHYENHDCITGEKQFIIARYLDSNDAPDDTYFPNGTSPYILANALLDYGDIYDETTFVCNMLLANCSDLNNNPIDVTYTAIDGTSGTNGMGKEGYDKLIDGDSKTKWCSDDEDLWLIFKTSKPITPSFYCLVTGGDTYTYTDRNWTEWKIYGANFTSDANADRSSDAWVLLDEKSDIGPDRLPAANRVFVYFDMTHPSFTPYEYFKIELTNPDEYLQMSEFSFGSEANFFPERDAIYEYYAQQNLDTIVACQQYIDDYYRCLNRLRATFTVEDFFDVATTISKIDDDIERSVELYVTFYEIVADLADAYHDGRMHFDDEESNSFPVNYWGTFLYHDFGPNVAYPYGSLSYINAHHQVTNDNLEALIYQMQCDFEYPFEDQGIED